MRCPDPSCRTPIWTLKRWPVIGLCPVMLRRHRVSGLCQINRLLRCLETLSLYERGFGVRWIAHWMGHQRDPEQPLMDTTVCLMIRTAQDRLVHEEQVARANGRETAVLGVDWIDYRNVALRSNHRR